MYLNKAFLIGNLTRDPELKALPSGTKVASFSIATNRLYKDKDGKKQEAAEFHNIVAFAKLGELCAQYLKKGQAVLVDGRIQTRSWETNGEKKYRTEIIADNVQFGAKASGAGSSAGAPVKAGDAPGAASSGPSEAIEYPSEEINPDDIPF
jgi:single-strand DNA-binding protein